MNEHYTYFKHIFKPKNNKNQTKRDYRIFPHAIHQSRNIKKIINELKDPNIILAESTKNSRNNHIKTIKTKNNIKRQGNLILSSKCICGLKIKLTRTGFNENGRMASKRILNNRTICSNTHAYNKIEFHAGLKYKSQTNYLLKYMRNWYKGTTDDTDLNLPNHRFAKLLPK